jgi:hypothetical protein
MVRRCIHPRVHRRRCLRLCPTPIVHRRFISAVTVGLTIGHCCHAPIFDEETRSSPLHAPRPRLGHSVTAPISQFAPAAQSLHGTPPFRPSNPYYILPFCRFQLLPAPLLSVDRQHPAPTTAFSGRSIISSSANAEGTTVGPTWTEFDMPINDKVKATRRRHAICVRACHYGLCSLSLRDYSCSPTDAT